MTERARTIATDCAALIGFCRRSRLAPACKRRAQRAGRRQLAILVSDRLTSHAEQTPTKHVPHSDNERPPVQSDLTLAQSRGWQQAWLCRRRRTNASSASEFPSSRPPITTRIRPEAIGRCERRHRPRKPRRGEPPAKKTARRASGRQEESRTKSSGHQEDPIETRASPWSPASFASRSTDTKTMSRCRARPRPAKKNCWCIFDRRLPDRESGQGSAGTPDGRRRGSQARREGHPSPEEENAGLQAPWREPPRLRLLEEAPSRSKGWPPATMS